MATRSCTSNTPQNDIGVPSKSRSASTPHMQLSCSYCVDCAATSMKQTTVKGPAAGGSCAPGVFTPRLVLVLRPLRQEILRVPGRSSASGSGFVGSQPGFRRSVFNQEEGRAGWLPRPTV